MEKLSGLLNTINHTSYQELLTRIPDRSVDVLLTDPPYNVEIAGEAWDSGFDLRRWIDAVLPKITDDGIVMVFNTLSNVQRVLIPTVEDFRDDHHAFTVVDTIEWGKTNPRVTIDISRQYEFLMVAYNNYNSPLSDRVYPEDHDPFFTNEIWETASELAAYKPVEIDHPTAKPIRLLENLIRTYTRPTDLLLDTTSGTGAIPVAARNTHRMFIASEFDVTYARLSQERLRRIRKTVPRSVFLTDWRSGNE